MSSVEAGLPAPPNRRLAPYVAAAVAVVVVALLAVLATRSPASDRETESPLLGRAAPALAGKTLNGGSFDIDNQRGKFVLVNFFASWCQPCIIEHPELKKLTDMHKEANDLTLVSVAFQDDEASIRRFFQTNGGDWPVLAGTQGSAVLEFGVFKLPETYLISPSGQVIYKFVGGIHAGEVESVIAQAREKAR